MTSLGNAGDPPTKSIISVFSLRDHGSGTVYQQRSQVDITTFSDTEQMILVT